MWWGIGIAQQTVVISGSNMDGISQVYRQNTKPIYKMSNNKTTKDKRPKMRTK